MSSDEKIQQLEARIAVLESALRIQGELFNALNLHDQRTDGRFVETTDNINALALTAADYDAMAAKRIDELSGEVDGLVEATAKLANAVNVLRTATPKPDATTESLIKRMAEDFLESEKWKFGLTEDEDEEAE
jgi:hypothetical protein